MKTIDEELAEVVDQLARRYARRWWWADEEDLRQVGWVAALMVKAKYDPRKARAGIKPLARPRIKGRLSRFLCANTSPVSASDHKRNDLIGLVRAPVDAIPEKSETTPETRLDVERWQARVRVVLREVVADPVVLASLLEGADPTDETLEAIRNSDELRELIRERNE